MTTKRDILHVTLGNDDWQPTVEDMQAVQELFQEAVRDPKGAVIVTRQGIEVEVHVDDVQEGEHVDVVHVTVANSFLDQPDVAEPDPEEVMEIFPIGKIEGHRLFCLYDEEIFVDVDAEYIDAYNLNQRGFYVSYGDGREEFLVSGKREQ